MVYFNLLIMQTIALLLILAVLIYDVEDVSCNSFLSKFHQNTYKLKDVRIQLISFQEDSYHTFIITPFKYNRTTTAHNATFSFKADVKDELEGLVQVYKFLSNEYREFAIRFQVNMQKAFEANVIGLADATKCGNFTTCYFYKDIVYHVCNFVVDETRFPPLIPNGRYKIEVQILYLNRQIALVDIFAEIYTPINYPKK